MSNVFIFKYLGIFAVIASQWELLKAAPSHEEQRLPLIHTRINGRRAIIRQSVEFEE